MLESWSSDRGRGELLGESCVKAPTIFLLRLCGFCELYCGGSNSDLSVRTVPVGGGRIVVQ